MKNIAYVKEISNENAVLQIKRECACGGKERCGAKCFTFADDTIEAVLYNTIGAKAGDYVEVEGNAAAVLMYSAGVFILPVCIGVILYVTADFFLNNGMIPYMISGAGWIVSAFFLLYGLNKTAVKRKASDFKITKIIKETGEKNG